MHTLRHQRKFLLSALAALVVMVLFMVSSNEKPTEQTMTTGGLGTFSPEPASTFGLPVGGVIEARDSITVRSQTAGTVATVAVEEGSIVSVGALLALVDVPLLQSRIALQGAENELTLLREDASVIGRSADEEYARIGEAAASATARFTEESAAYSVENSASLLVTQLHGSVVGLTSALDFIDNNEPRFSREALSLFRETVGALYGDSQTYFNGPVRYKLDSHDDILAYLESVTEGDVTPATDELVSIARLIDAELDAVRSILTDGESDFLDPRVVSDESTLYASYFMQRENIIEAQALLQARIGAAELATVSGDLQTISAHTERELSRVQYGTATSIVENARAAREQSSTVSHAALGVLSAEGELGMPRAPFDGVIGEVFVEHGEFVQPGSPLFTLVGTGARELRVTVSSTMLPYLKEGAPFTVGGNVVGYVDRFSPVLTKGSILVFIELTDGDYVVGDVLRGEIVCEFGAGGVLGVPRPYVSFDSSGAFITTESGTIVRVRVVHDTGKTLVVDPATHVTDPLQKAVGITF